MNDTRPYHGAVCLAILVGASAVGWLALYIVYRLAKAVLA